MRSIMAALLAALILPGVATLAQPGPMALPVKAAPVIQDMIIAEITALGTLRSDEAIIVRPEIAGRVQTIHFQEGQLVNKNDPLFTLDPAEYKAQLDGSTAQLRMEQLNFERARPDAVFQTAYQPAKSGRGPGQTGRRPRQPDQGSGPAG